MGRVKKITYHKKPLPPVDFTNRIWVDHRGRKIDICRMATHHISNCIVMLEKDWKHPETGEKWIPIFREELKRRATVDERPGLFK